MAPAHMRGALNITFQLATTIGILAAQCINYGTSFIAEWGWRLSLALAGVPSGFLFLGGMFLPDTPNSLVHRGHPDQGRKVRYSVGDILLRYLC
jgi:MFS family permease